jgi:hypothetical protein
MFHIFHTFEIALWRRPPKVSPEMLANMFRSAADLLKFAVSDG